jgi:DNA-binding transcriptional LysR family regulator
MQIDGLRVFCTLVDTEHFTQTAQILGVTQSAVSQLISAMEKMLGRSLIDRSRRKFRVRPAGQAVYEYGRQIVEMEKELESAMEKARRRAEITLRVATSSELGLYLLPRHLGGAAQGEAAGPGAN